LFETCGDALETAAVIVQTGACVVTQRSFLSVGKDEVWAFGSEVNQFVECLVGFTTQVMNYFETYVPLQCYFLGRLKSEIFLS
jgi:hypothetical protein